MGWKRLKIAALKHEEMRVQKKQHPRVQTGAAGLDLDMGPSESGPQSLTGEFIATWRVSTGGCVCVPTPPHSSSGTGRLGRAPMVALMFPQGWHRCDMARVSP